MASENEPEMSHLHTTSHPKALRVNHTGIHTRQKMVSIAYAYIHYLSLYLQVLSADNLCKQFRPRPSLFFGGSDLDPNCLTLKEFFKKVDFLKKKKYQHTTKKHAKFPSRQRVKCAYLAIQLG